MAQLTIPPCTNACPVKTDVRGYVAAIARREYYEAYRLIRENNPFPSVCAWVCTYPCEENCRRGSVEGPVSIRMLKKYVMETGIPYPFQKPSHPTGKKVAVVGSGPAGLTAAYDLALAGHSVTVYERQTRPGGNLASVLPLFRLPRNALKEDIRIIIAAGVNIITGVEVGSHISLAEIRAEYDCVIVGSGHAKSRTLPGMDGQGILTALSFLEAVNNNTAHGAGKKVLVVGGGGVAVDAARTAIRQGSQVAMVCLEAIDNMPAYYTEVDKARAEGIRIIPGFGPLEATRENGMLTGLTIRKVETLFDAEGKFSPVYSSAGIMTEACDTVILAVGQSPDYTFMNGIGKDPGYGIGDLEKDCPGIFACGEITTGPGSTIKAIASGHGAAVRAQEYMTGSQGRAIEASLLIGPVPPETARIIPRRQRCEAGLLTPRERVRGMDPYEKGFDDRKALYEASRCMNCGWGAVVDEKKCIACLTCSRVCPYNAPLVDRRAGVPVEDCQACGICAGLCPTGAITVRNMETGTVEDSLQEYSRGKVVVFTCRGCSPDTARKKGKDEKSGHELWVELPTIDSLPLEWILKSFESGATGVVIYDCCGEKSRYAGGNNVVRGVYRRAGALLERLGIGSDRVYWCSFRNGEDAIGKIRSFAGYCAG